MEDPLPLVPQVDELSLGLSKHSLPYDFSLPTLDMAQNSVGGSFS